MKKMNRREFLTLTGASVALLALAACGGAPSTPVAPAGSKEAKVLEAIKKYRAAAGVKEPLALDNGLKPAAELVVKIAKGEMAFDEKAAEALGKAAAGYNVSGRPIGMSMNSSGSMMPVCVYTENVDLLVKNLSMLDEADQTNLKSASLIAIQLFEYGGVKYWVAVAANGKK